MLFLTGVRKGTKWAGLLAAMLLFSSQAWAALTVNITSPAEGATVHPGDPVSFSISISGATYGISGYTIHTLDGYTISDTFPASPPTNSLNLSGGEFWSQIPANQPSGSATLLSITVSGHADDPVSATRHVNVVASDTTAPTFATGQVGVKKVTRLYGNTQASVTWYQATDNVTSNANIRYLVYASTSAGSVFPSMPAEASLRARGVTRVNPSYGTPTAVVTGSLTTTLSGLNRLSTYYVGVRAMDAAGNIDANTVTLQVDPLPNAVGAAWSLYE